MQLHVDIKFLQTIRQKNKLNVIATFSAILQQKYTYNVRSIKSRNLKEPSKNVATSVVDELSKIFANNATDFYHYFFIIIIQIQAIATSSKINQETYSYIQGVYGLLCILLRGCSVAHFKKKSSYKRMS